MTRRRLRIALLIESSRAYGRALLDGVADYARAYGPWTFYHVERSIDDPVPARLRQWRPDGVIARLVNRTQVRDIRRLGVPTVDVLGELACPGIPQIVPDQPAIVRAAVDHLLGRGLRQLAYAGFHDVVFSKVRGSLLVQYAKVAGCPASVFDDRGRHHASGLAGVEEETLRHDRRLAAWLRSLPKPVGLLACNDVRAHQVLSVCGECGILVPEQVAIIGVDDDPVPCQLSDPPLSSVDPDAHRIGHEAAAALRRMIAGRQKLAAITRVPPRGVVARQSSDVLAIADPEVVAAVRLVRQHACEGLTPESLADRMAVSRRTLFRRFERHLGHSPAEEIARVRLERVRDLLVSSDLPSHEIARLAGFAYTETMHRLFRRRFGQAPGAYRAARRRIDAR